MDSSRPASFVDDEFSLLVSARGTGRLQLHLIPYASARNRSSSPIEITIDVRSVQSFAYNRKQIHLNSF